MSGWPIVPLAELADVNGTTRTAFSADDRVSFVPMASASAEAGLTENVKVVPFAEVAKGYTSFQNGDILAAKVTPCFQNGKTVEAVLPTEFGFGSTEFHVVRPIEGKASARYLLHFLRQERVRVQGEASMTGTGGQRRVPARFFQQLEIPAPPLAEQRRIADILDRAGDLRAKRQAAIDKLDSLTQAIFHDMFGGGSSCPGWSRSTLGELADFINGYPFKPADLGEHGLPVIRIREMLNTDVVPDKSTADVPDKCVLADGDLLFSWSATLATAFWDRGTALLNQHLFRVVPTEDVHPVWLRSALDQAIPSLVARSHGSTMKHITKRDLLPFPVTVPPVELQREFALRVGLVDGVRAGFTGSLQSTGALARSLQQRAFSGAL